MNRMLTTGAAALATLAVIALASPATAVAAGPLLSITITDGRDATSAGEESTFTVVVENQGADDALGLTITQNVPDGMAFDSADADGTEDGSTVSWTTDIPVGQSATFMTTMTVGDTPKDLLRMATVACAFTSPTDPPIECASDSNLLPAGESSVAPPAAIDSGATWWIVAGSIALAATASVVVILLARRRRLAPRGARVASRK